MFPLLQLLVEQGLDVLVVERGGYNCLHVMTILTSFNPVVEGYLRTVYSLILRVLTPQTIKHLLLQETHTKVTNPGVEGYLRTVYSLILRVLTPQTIKHLLLQETHTKVTNPGVEGYLLCTHCC